MIVLFFDACEIKIACGSFCSVLRTVNSYYETSVDLTAIGEAACDSRIVAQ